MEGDGVPADAHAFKSTVEGVLSVCLSLLIMLWFRHIYLESF